MNPLDHLALWTALVVLGCGHSGATDRTPVAAAAPNTQHRVVFPQPEPPPSASIGDAMTDHFAITTFARDAVIAGLLEPLQAPLQALVHYRYEDVRASSAWMPWIAQLQTIAQSTSQATTLEVAALGVANMARVCGECHVAMHDGPVWAPAMAADEERREIDSVEERMGRHDWAARQLWKGLTGPSDGSWRAGAQALIDAPAELDVQLPEDFDDELREVRALGQSAREATRLAERAEVYGTLIGRCAQCHARWNDHAAGNQG